MTKWLSRVCCPLCRLGACPNMRSMSYEVNGSSRGTSPSRVIGRSFSNIGISKLVTGASRSPASLKEIRRKPTSPTGSVWEPDECPPWPTSYGMVSASQSEPATQNVKSRKTIKLIRLGLTRLTNFKKKKKSSSPKLRRSVSDIFPHRTKPRVSDQFYNGGWTDSCSSNDESVNGMDIVKIPERPCSPNFEYSSGLGPVCVQASAAVASFNAPTSGKPPGLVKSTGVPSVKSSAGSKISCQSAAGTAVRQKSILARTVAQQTPTRASGRLVVVVAGETAVPDGTRHSSARPKTIQPFVEAEGSAHIQATRRNKIPQHPAQSLPTAARPVEPAKPPKVVNSVEETFVSDDEDVAGNGWGDFNTEELLGYGNGNDGEAVTTRQHTSHMPAEEWGGWGDDSDDTADIDDTSYSSERPKTAPHFVAAVFRAQTQAMGGNGIPQLSAPSLPTVARPVKSCSNISTRAANSAAECRVQTQAVRGNEITQPPAPSQSAAIKPVKPSSKIPPKVINSAEETFVSDDEDVAGNGWGDFNTEELLGYGDDDDGEAVTTRQHTSHTSAEEWGGWEDDSD